MPKKNLINLVVLDLKVVFNNNKLHVSGDIPRSLTYLIFLDKGYLEINSLRKNYLLQSFPFD